jgi:hypothetical protein
VIEEVRIRFLVLRDGEAQAIAWVKRTLRIYRSAVLDDNHYAHSGAFRHGFIESYCDLKQWLTHMHTYGDSSDPE